MPLFLIVFLMLACAPVQWPEPYFGASPVLCVVTTVLVMLAPVIRSLYYGCCAAGLLRQPNRYNEAGITAYRGRARQTACIVAAFVVAMVFGGWGWCVQHTLVGGDDATLLPGAELVLLTPFFAAWVGSWACFFVYERRLSEVLGRSQLRFGRYCLEQFRQQWALATLPVAIILIEQSVMRSLPRDVDHLYVRIGSVATVLILLLTAPWSLRWLLGLRPLPEGALRDRLEKTARRMRFRFSDFLVWDTRGLSANAMIAGVLPRPRYVLFTDQLLADLGPDEVEAVLGHEIGHVRAGHLGLYTAFLGLSLVALAGAGNWLQSLLGGSRIGEAIAQLGEWQTLPSVALFGVYVLFAFGFLSRRCEREADLYGCRAVSCGCPDCNGHVEQPASLAIAGTVICPTGVATFINALERVAVANGICRDKPGWIATWRHGSIARRVDFLERVRNDPGMDRRYRRRLNWLKLGLLATLIVFVAVLGHAGFLTQLWS